MYAIVKTGGKQYRVEPGQAFLVEKLNAEEKKRLELTEILAYGEGADFKVGKPRLGGAVVCSVIGHEKGEKLRTIKYRRRANYRRTYGHRQWYTRLLVESIELKRSPHGA